jgi:ribose transport system ATP-binding protein
MILQSTHLHSSLDKSTPEQAYALPGGQPDAARQGTTPLVELQSIHKRFPGVNALSDVSLELYGGEVHVLLGENGAGKSTLMKVLCGAYLADSGRLIVDGQEVKLHQPGDARQLGIAVIFQEFSLVPYLSVAQNILLGREPRHSLLGTLDRKKLHAQASEAMALIGLDVDPNAPLHSLGVAQQQMVEIAKALSQNAKVLILDEPTATLSDRESEKLFAVMKRLKSQGVALAYISHRMAEVFALGDRITVLRDGAHVTTCKPQEVNPDELIRLMVGRDVDMSYARRKRIKQHDEVKSTLLTVPALRVEGLSAASGIRDINLHVNPGEIVGLCGLVGSGRTEVVRAIFGADARTEGIVKVWGDELASNPSAARRAGIGLIPENRKSEGLALSRSIAANLVITAYRKLFPTGIVWPSQVSRVASDLILRMRIAAPSEKQLAGALSGGNQQKIVIGKWLAAGTRLFLFDEPTRGIDVGAKSEIFQLIYELVDAGAAVLMISSEQQEIVNVCDRAYVMRAGSLVGELKGEALTEFNIVRLAVNHG